MAQTPARIEHDHGPPVAFADTSLDKWQTKFLQAYAESGSIAAAVRLSHVHHSYHYKWLKENAEYSIAYGVARDIYGDQAEGEVRRRGIQGYDKELSYKGKLTGDKTREYSDVLAMAVIKALKPEYRDGQQIAVGPAKIAIEIINAAGDLQRNSVASTGIEVAVQIPEIAEEIQAPQVQLPPDLPPQKQAPPLRPGRK